MQQLLLPGIVYSPLMPGDSRSVYPDPMRLAIDTVSRNQFYSLVFSYYTNTAFEDVREWAKYKLKHNLYRYMRSLINPTAKIVDFYADHVYPGVLSEGVDLPNGIQSAIPLSHDVAMPLRMATAQTWQWSNWQNLQAMMVTYGAMTGNCLVEIIDDPETGKIRYKVTWPGHVKIIVLDGFGNVKGYVLEYDVYDPFKRERYRFAKEVQLGVVRYYKNGSPFDYGQGVEQFLPYPFVPAVWVKHLDIGSDYGVPAIKTGIGKIDEINSIMSHTADHIHKQIRSPRIMWTDTNVKPLFGDTAVDDDDFDSRDHLMMLKGAKGGSTDTLVGNLDPQTIVPIIDKLLKELEFDYPELTMYEHLRARSVVTAPGARMMMGDVAHKLSRVSTNYDTASVKLFQMGVAIGGFRANLGSWGFDKSKLTPQQQKFLPFSFDSYSRGQLDMMILPRPLALESTKEVADELAVRAQAVANVKDALPVQEKLQIMGYRDDQLASIESRLTAEQATAAKTALDLAQATKPQPQPIKSGDTTNAKQLKVA